MLSANKSDNFMLIAKYLITTRATFSDAKTLTFSTMIKKTQFYKIRAFKLNLNEFY